MIHDLVRRTFQAGAESTGGIPAVAPGTYEADPHIRAGERAPPPSAIRDLPGASSSSSSQLPTQQALQGVGPAGTMPNVMTSSHMAPPARAGMTADQQRFLDQMRSRGYAHRSGDYGYQYRSQ